MKRLDMKVGTIYNLKGYVSATLMLDDYGYDRVVRDGRYVYLMNVNDGGRWIRVMNLSERNITLMNYDWATSMHAETVYESIIGAKPQIGYIQPREILETWSDHVVREDQIQAERLEVANLRKIKADAFKEKETMFYNQLAWLGLDPEKFQCSPSYGSGERIEMPMDLCMKLLTSLITQVPVTIQAPVESDAESPNDPALD